MPRDNRSSNPNNWDSEPIEFAPHLRDRARRIDALSVVALVLVSAALRLPFVDNPLLYDESVTYVGYAKAKTLWGALSTYDVPNNHIFHTILVRLTTLVLGDSVTSLRLPALVSGVAIAPLTYLVGRHLMRPSNALVAALCTATMYRLAEYSVNARGYTLQCALLLISLLFVTKAVRTSSWIATSVAGTSLALAIFVVPSLVFGAGTPLLWGAMLIQRNSAGPRRRALARLLAVAGIGALLTGVLYAPALNYVRHGDFHIPGSPPYPPSALKYVRDTFNWLFSCTIPGFGWGLLVCGLVSATSDLLRKRAPLALAVTMWPALAVSLHFALAPQAPFARNFIFMMPLLMLLIGDAGRGLTRRSGPLGQLTCAVTVSVALVVAAWNGHGAAAQLARLRKEDHVHVAYRALLEMHPGDYVATHASVGRVLFAYSEMDPAINFHEVAMSWRLGVLQRTDGLAGKQRPRPFADTTRVFVVDTGRIQRRDVLKWAKRLAPGHRLSLTRYRAAVTLPSGTTLWLVVREKL